MSHPARRIVLYSHDAMGIGHVRRNLRIAHALRSADDRTSVLLISGVAEGTWFPLPPGVDFLAVPSLKKHDNGCYAPRRLKMEPDELVEVRARTIAAAVESFKPDALIVDKIPRGVAGELVPALKALRQSSRTKCVLGLRDVLDDAQVVRDEWQSGGYDEWITRHYDAVWVYGDPALYDTAAEYAFSPAIRAMTRYTGYLDRIESGPSAEPALSPKARHKQIVLCTCGGGEDAGPLARAFAAAKFGPDQHGILLTGPFMPASDRHAVHAAAEDRSDLDVIDFSPDPLKLLERASRVVLMGGYNSVCEVLATDVPALVVPRVRPRSEQMVRAERLAERGMIELLHPDRADAEAISQWISRPVAPPANRRSLDFGGLDRLPALLNELLGQRPQIQATVRAPRRASHVVG